MKVEKENRSILVLCGIITIMILMGIFSAGCFGDDDDDDNNDDNDNLDNDDDDDTEVTVKTRKVDKGDTGWFITIDSVSGDLKLEDVKFRFVELDNDLKWEKTIGEANPISVTSGDSKIYAIPYQPGTPVRDITTNVTIADQSNPKYYELAFMAYIDSRNNGRISEGDAFYIYKDYDSDGTIDLTGFYSIEIRTGNDYLAGSQEL